MNQLEEKNTQLEAKLEGMISDNSQQLSSNQYNEQKIDLGELWTVIWRGKILIIVITAIFSIASVFYALSVSDEYKSTVLMAPASSSSSSSLSKLAGKFGGLASLAGINLGGGGSEDKTAVAIEIIKTWGFLEEFIQENNIEVAIYAAEGWDRANNQLVINPKLYDVNNKKWVRSFDASKGQKQKPSGWELYELLIDRVAIYQDQETGFITLSVEHYSPILAKEWTDKLVKAINKHIQKQDRDEATRSISYLNKKISETNLSDMQAVFYQLIEEQTKNLMLAEVSNEYVFKTLSPAKVAEEKSKPSRAVIAILGFILGGMLSIVIVLIRHFSAKNNT